MEKTLICAEELIDIAISNAYEHGDVFVWLRKIVLESVNECRQYGTIIENGDLIVSDSFTGRVVDRDKTEKSSSGVDVGDLLCADCKARISDRMIRQAIMDGKGIEFKEEDN